MDERGDRIMIAYLLEALGGALAIAFIAYYTWHEDKLIAFENRIAKAVRERISRYAIQILSQVQASKRPQYNRCGRKQRRRTRTPETFQ